MNLRAGLLASISALLIFACDAGSGPGEASCTVLDWRSGPSTQSVQQNLIEFEDVQIRLVEASVERGGDGLVVSTRAGSGRVGIAARFTGGGRNLKDYGELTVAVRNLGSTDLRIILRVDDSATENLPTAQTRKCIYQAYIAPGSEPVLLAVPLCDLEPAPLEGKFISMVGQPVDFIPRGAVNATNITAISIFTPDPEEAHTFSIGPIVARGTPAPFRNWPTKKVFPIVDDFGQYAHREWTNKIHGPEDFERQKTAEAVYIKSHPRPVSWDRFGGWAGGPQLKSTGYFRVERINGAWWMVDPEGRLFWSHGVVRVGTRIRVGTEYRGTPLPDREPFFKLPEKDSPFGVFYGTEPQSNRRYYVGRDNHAIYDFLEANLFRKYGANWKSEYALKAQHRLESWGLNTIANSSDPHIYLKRQTPYTAIVYSAPLGESEFRLQGSTGNWGKLPDPFDPGWRALMDKTLRTGLSDSLDDPWCIGFFVDNELNWGDPNYIPESTLNSPPEQPAKRAFAATLQRKYKQIQNLNDSWGTAFAEWPDLLRATPRIESTRPGVKKDFAALTEQYLTAYFKGCRDAVKAAAPNQMYLGCRFAQAGNEIVMRIASRHCDVVSINRYANSVSDLSLGEGLDKPILIGEFHFKSTDAPMQPSGLVLVTSHSHRGQSYMTYVESALRNPAIVGTHWFQYYDQPTTGRFDGENYQTGLLDICDTPYAETISACRQMGQTLYQIRSETFSPNKGSNHR